MSKIIAGKAVKVPSTQRLQAPATPKESRVSLNKIATRGVDLGGGYVLLKLNDAAQAAPRAKRTSTGASLRKLPGLQTVSAVDVEALLERVIPDMRSRPSSAKRSKDGVKQRNQAFIDQFEQKEIERRAELERKGALLNSNVLAERLNVTRQAITKAVKNLRMFSLDGASGQKLYPAFFADDSLERSQLETVSKELDRLPGASKWQFFTTPRLSLGSRNPLDALRKGKYVEVMAAARAFKEA